jgi:hypothetical protein
MFMARLPLAAMAAGLLSATATGAEPAALKGEADVRNLCLGLRPLERVTFAGHPAQRAQAKQDFEKERERLLQTEFAVELPWGGFTVSEWDPAEKVATVAAERPFRAAGGALVFFDPDRDAIDLGALEGAEDALQTALAKGQVSLAVTFRLAEEEGSPCVSGKAKTYTLAVDLISAELRMAGKALARALGEGFEPRTGAAAVPSVVLKPAPAQDCEKCSDEVARSAMAVKPLVEKCYAEALAKQPGLDGSLVLGLAAGKDGKVQVESVVLDSVQNAEVVACVKKAMGAARAPARGGRGMVIVQLELR